MITWFYRESICIYLFLKAAVDPTVKWRNGTYRLKYGGLAEEVIDSKSEKEKKKSTLNDIELTAPQIRTTSPQTNINRKSLNLGNYIFITDKKIVNNYLSMLDIVINT